MNILDYDNSHPELEENPPELFMLEEYYLEIDDLWEALTAQGGSLEILDPSRFAHLGEDFTTQRKMVIRLALKGDTVVDRGFGEKLPVTEISWCIVDAALGKVRITGSYTSLVSLEREVFSSKQSEAVISFADELNPHRASEPYWLKLLVYPVGLVYGIWLIFWSLTSCLTHTFAEKVKQVLK